MTFRKAATTGGALAIALLPLGCVSAPAGDRAIESKVSNARIWPRAATVFVRAEGEPRRCLQTANTFFVVNDENSVVFMNDGRFFINRLQLPCEGVLINGFTQSAGFGRSQICSGMSVTLQDEFGGNPNALCHLGSFEPLELADTGADGEKIVLNEGETIRRPR
ncbi:hypothetical protein [Erythrobacter sp. HL-111]|uniref:hypothetical protein n=1 Tax=Erythrobacter sp. HL-111 TaxID=1798193 RepID=UPI0006DAE60E|nr:hypothetical protein [Erythrobacter sp. HL-111]KPP94350.1 MAG: hypothetical protein HLUCCO15_04195 [Erythrobacteraceae bacterium HL-111]SDS52051.1 hypothetical protein SAMN04515621_1717 [Erythrobacter sp. HL-111]